MVSWCYDVLSDHDKLEQLDMSIAQAVQGHTVDNSGMAREENEGTTGHPNTVVSGGAVTVLSSTVLLPMQDKLKEGGSEMQKDTK